MSQGVSAACVVFDTALAALEMRGAGRSIDAESIYIAYAKLLYRHTTSGEAFKPRLLGSVLDKALEMFPNNTILMSLFLWNEARTKIEGRVRRFLNQILERYLTNLSCDS